MVLRAYSWFFTQELVLVVLREPYAGDQTQVICMQSKHHTTILSIVHALKHYSFTSIETGIWQCINMSLCWERD